MHTKESLIEGLRNLGLNPKGTTLAHFSYKSLGLVEGGPQTVIDAMVEYHEEGLMVFPTHTWANVNQMQPNFSVDETPSCVGAIAELARKTKGGVRSAHPTHSVVAFGRDAGSFTMGEEKQGTPCSRTSVWGKLLDRDATILLVGVRLNRDTFIHGIEEWLGIPNRIADQAEKLYSKLSDGSIVPVMHHPHLGHISEHYPRVEPYLLEKGVLEEGKLGDAKVLYHKARSLYETLKPLLLENPNLFGDL